MVRTDRIKHLSRTFLLALAALLFWGVLLIIQPFLQQLIAAAILTIAFYPAYEFVRRKIVNRSLAALVCVLLLLVLFLVPIGFLTATVISDARGFYSQIKVESIQVGGWAEYFNNHIDPPIQWIAQRTGVAAPGLKAAFLQKTEQILSGFVKWGSALFGNLAATIGNIVLVLFVVFFLFQGGESIHRAMVDYLPIERRKLDYLLSVTRTAIVANLYGMVAVGTVQGVLVGIGYAIAGLASPALWGLVAAFASLIPIVGTALVWVPAAIYLLAAGFWGKAIFLTVWGVVVVGMSDNFVRPYVLSRGLQMNTLAIFLSLMGGLQVMGFIGLFAGPVIFTLAFVVIRILNEERLEWEGRLPEQAVEAGAAPGGEVVEAQSVQDRP